jgi:hypothetical protein
MPENQPGDENKQEETFKVEVSRRLAVEVTVDVTQPLRELVREATKDEGGRRLEDWEIRSARNAGPLDQTKTIKSYKFPNEALLYVDLLVGGGG